MLNEKKIKIRKVQISTSDSERVIDNEGDAVIMCYLCDVSIHQMKDNRPKPLQEQEYR